MKLSSQQVASVKRELGADPLDSNNPAVNELNNVFGEHTFYLATDGLFIVEPVESDQIPGEPAQIVRVAAWTDDDKKELQPVPPEATERVLDLTPGSDDSSDPAA